MYLQTKKVVIIYIVSLITALSIISSLYNEVKETSPQIAVVSPEELSYKVSFAQTVLNELTLDVTQEQDVLHFGSSLFQIDENASVQFTNIVNSNEITIVIGDSFNSYLPSLIEENEEKQFILLENSANFNYPNVYQLNIDYDEIYSQVNRTANDVNKSLVIVTNQFSDLAENSYYEHNIAANPNVKLVVIDNTSDNVQIKNQILEEMNKGYVNVYSLNPYSNSIIIDTVNEFNADSVAEVSEEQDEEKAIAESSSENSVDENEPIKSAKLKYLTLNQNEYISESNNNNLGAYIYDLNNYLLDIVEDSLTGELQTGQRTISITNI